MSRSKAQSKARQKALSYPELRGKRAKPPKKIRLYQLLPRVGFDWMFVPGAKGIPDLRQDFVFSIQTAIRETYGRINTIRTKFDDAMAEVILRGTEMEDSVIDTDPIEFWAKVKESFEGTDSFVNHHRMTPSVIFNFLAYAIDARLASIDGPDLNRPNAEANLAKAVDSLRNEFAHEPYAETKDAYFERPKEAGWMLNYNVDENKMDVDDEINNDCDTDTEEESEEDEELEGEEELEDGGEEDDEKKKQDDENKDVDEQDGEAMEGVVAEAETLQEDFQLPTFQVVVRPRDF